MDLSKAFMSVHWSFYNPKKSFCSVCKLQIIDNMVTDDHIIICENCIDVKTPTKSIEPIELENNENSFIGSVINYMAYYLPHRGQRNSSAV